MKIICDNCFAEIDKKPSAIKEKNFCDKECYKEYHSVIKPCGTCGKPVRRTRATALENVFCNRECARPYISKRLTDMNIELNPDRMIPSTRIKLRNHHLDTGEGKTYAKIFSRHAHRVIAEQMLGRPLKKGEVVHHIDENKRNNDPSNLIIFPSQAEHARHHMKLRYAKNA